MSNAFKLVNDDYFSDRLRYVAGEEITVEELADIILNTPVEQQFIRQVAYRNKRCPFNLIFVYELSYMPDGASILRYDSVREHPEEFKAFLDTHGLTLEDVESMPASWFKKIFSV